MTAGAERSGFEVWSVVTGNVLFWSPIFTELSDAASCGLLVSDVADVGFCAAVEISVLLAVVSVLDLSRAAIT